MADEPAAGHLLPGGRRRRRTPASARTPTRSPATPLDPEPYEPGSYPRLKPYDPPPPNVDAPLVGLVGNTSPTSARYASHARDDATWQCQQPHAAAHRDRHAGRGSTPPSAAARSSRRRGGCSATATTAPSRPPTSPPRPGSRAGSSTTTSAASASSTSRSCARCWSCRRACSPTSSRAATRETALGAAVDRWLDVSERSGGVLLAAHGAQGFGRDAGGRGDLRRGARAHGRRGDRDPAARASPRARRRPSCAPRSAPTPASSRRRRSTGCAAGRSAATQLRELLVGGLLALDRDVVPERGGDAMSERDPDPARRRGGRADRPRPRLARLADVRRRRASSSAPATR